jgi:hypothetical protein
MAFAVKPSYAFPAGYVGAKYSAPYVPWNGSLFAASPARRLRGASQILAVASVPADLSTLIITAPNGEAFTFQFVYNASVQTLGIKVPLPASGGSTAAQVTTALATVLASIPAFNIGSTTPVYFPWVAIQGDATHVTLNYTVAGALTAIGGTQVTISVSASAPSAFVIGTTAPGLVGPIGAFLHGD